MASPVPAGVIWDGGGADSNIDTPTNWNDDTLPDLIGSAANLVFAGNARLTPEINVAIRPLGLRFDATAGQFVIGGTNTITTGTTGTTNGDIINDSPLTQTINAPILMRRGALDAAAGDLVINGPINVGGGSGASGRSLTLRGAHDVFINGTIEGTGTSASAGGVISKLSTGVWHITSNSPLWAGRIGIDVGMLRISAPDALGDPTSRTLVQGGGATGKSRLELTGGVTFAPERLELTGRETGSSPIHLSNFSGNNTWTGDAILLTGGAEYGFDSAAGKLTVTGNVVNRSGNATARTIRFSGAAEGEFAGLFLNDTGTGALTIRKEDAGRWTFTNPGFTYAGDTLITGGTLAFGPGISINGTPNIEIAAGATLDLSGGSLDRGPDQTLTGAGRVLGQVNNFGGVISPNIPALANSAATLTFANGLTLNAGTVKFDLSNILTPGGGVNDLIEVTGNLMLTGNTEVAIHALAGGISNGIYRLFTYSGALSGGASNLRLAFPATRQTTTIDTSSANQVNLVVSGAAANLIWKGDGAFNTWDVNVSTNWRNGISPDKFFNLDNVTFDDTAGAASTTVDLADDVFPGSITVNSALDYTFTGGGTISGVTGLTKSGPGKLTIDTNNNNSGLTIITEGIVQIGAGLNTGSLGTGNIVNHAAVVFNRSTGLTVPGVISGSGSVEQQGTGTITLAADNTYTGPTTISSGTLQIGTGGPTGSIGPGAITNNGLLIISRATDLKMANLISGTGGLDKRDTGVLELTAVNTYTGPTTINGSSSTGGLLVDNLQNGGLPSDIGGSTAEALNLHIRTNGTLHYVGSGVTTDRLFTIGNARIEASGTGPLVFANTGAIATSGGNRTLTLLGANVDDNVLAPSIVDSGPTGVTSFAKLGDGKWVLAGNNTFSGAATLSTGTLRLATATALGATQPLPENTNAAGTTITGDVGGSGRLVLSGGITFAPEPLTLQARQGPTATIPHLVNAGGNNQWTGPITLTTGGFEYTLQSDIGTLTIDSDLVQSATTLERFLNLQGAGNGVINGAIINGGGSQVQTVRKRGAGTWTLNGGNTYIGATNIEGGTLRVGASGAVTNDGPVTVDSGATFAVDGTVTVRDVNGAGSTRVGDRFGPAALTAGLVRQASLFIGPGSRVTTKPAGGTSVVGELSIPAGGPLIPGTLDIQNNKAIVDYADAGSNPQALVRLRIIEGRGAVGLGAKWTGAGITSGTAASDVATDPESRSVGYADNGTLPLGPYTSFGGQPVDDTSLLMAYTRTGDANLDGVVNDDDVTIVGATYAPGVPQPHWALGDFDYNGFVDDDDVTLLGVFYDPNAAPLVASAAVAAGGVASVPEPASVVLLVFATAALGIVAFRSRRL
ncbi:MAG: autotransporter-associated beta strand repeat-containing protein [Pirellulales bacterium]